MTKTFLIVAAAVFFVVHGFFIKNAYAYLDPGSGSYMFQLLIAATVSGLFALKLAWKKIVKFFKKPSPKVK